MKSLIPISFAIMLVVPGLLLRSLPGVCATRLVILMSITVCHLSKPNIDHRQLGAHPDHFSITNCAEAGSGAMMESLRVNPQPVFLTSLGIVVDDTLHFLSKYLRARREHGFRPRPLI